MEDFNQILHRIKNLDQLTKEQQSQILKHLENSEDREAHKEALLSQWNQISIDEKLSLEQPDTLFYKLFYQLHGTSSSITKKQRFITILQRVAAILFLPLLIVSSLFLIPIEQADNRIAHNIEITSPSNQNMRFYLPDGTSGWLRAGSKLTYNSKNESRNLDLTGGVYFEVAKDETRPFYVNAEAFQVKVLGTKFNMSCYPSAKNHHVFLEEGSVEMLDLNAQQRMVLEPGDFYDYDLDSKKFSVSSKQTDEALAWTSDKLIFRNTELREVIKELEIFYQVEIELSNRKLGSLPVHATIDNQKLSEVLDFLELILPVNCEIKNEGASSQAYPKKRKVVIRNRN
jgi:ferric-dicitrate binding protein FerR (iron transport regulator)